MTRDESAACDSTITRAIVYLHLRTHSDYSLGQSNIKTTNLVTHAISKKMPALGMVDYFNMFGALEFAIECSSKGIQPITGCIVLVNYDQILMPQEKKRLISSSKQDYGKRRFIEGEPILGEVLLIARNEIGFKNLLQIVSSSYLNPKTDQNNHWLEPHIGLDELVAHLNGLTVFVGHIDSPCGALLEAELNRAADSLVQLLQNVPGTDLFIELVRYPSRTRKQIELENSLLTIAFHNDIPIVATNPVQYLAPENWESCDALSCIIQSNYLLQEDRRAISKEHYFKSSIQMQELFSDLPEAIENSSLVARTCSFMPQKSKEPLLPLFSSTGEKEILKLQAYQGLAMRMKDQKALDGYNLETYQERLDFELSVIAGMNFAGYFLIVSDFIKWSKRNKIPVGPGRGSGAGSLVAWVLEITELNPLRFGLLFERFLNPDRVSMPDFDIDFCQIRRDEVISYVRNKYGHDRVAHIMSFGKLQARAVLRDVGRVLQLPYGLLDKICKMIPNNPAHPVTLQEAIDMDSNLQQMRDTEQDINKLLRISLELEGVHRHASTHGAGIVIADRPLVELVPLYKDPNYDMPAIQYSLKYAEAAGLVKFDFLGLKTVTLIDETTSLVNKRGNNLNVSEILLDDHETYKVMSRGDCIGIFQFESAGMRSAIKSLGPDCIEDLIALVSLYRPGPMDNIPHYIARKRGIEEIDYLHPKLQSTLGETYGIIVYQEQVMRIAQAIAGYSLAEADLLRRAMGKKNQKEMNAQKEHFISGAVANGITEKQAVEIFTIVDRFASYGFNKSHAAAYAVISYQTAYLKTHYTLEFMTVLINLEIDDKYKVNVFCIEAKRFAIKVLPPDINFSEPLCSIESEMQIRFGLRGIKGFPTKIIDAIAKERLSNNFCDIWDFLRRCVPLGINVRILEMLAKAGAFRSIHPNIAQLLDNSKALIEYGTQTCKSQQSVSQLNLFEVSNDSTKKPDLIDSKTLTEKEMMAKEYEALGLYLNRHPIEPYIKNLTKIGVVFSDQVEEKVENEQFLTIKVAGVITSKKVKSGRGKNASKFAFIQLSDHMGIIDASIFDEALLYKVNDLLIEGNLIFCKVAARMGEGGLRLIAESVSSVEEALESATSLPGMNITEVWLNSFEETVDDCESQDRVTLLISDQASLSRAKQKVFYLTKEDAKLRAIHHNPVIEVNLITNDSSGNIVSFNSDEKCMFIDKESLKDLIDMVVDMQ